ncbi:lipoxygenase family protein [Pyruvatibacter sp.]|uniref:lipoxygenase family protein n=1 Tax=Pyruvatibacter sp. TaxID=1981328 RepID=UPI0032EB234D
MATKSRLTINRRLALGGALSLPFVTTAWARVDVSLPQDACGSGQSRVIENVYEFDLDGKPVEWDYPSGKASSNGLTLKGLGLQRTGSEKKTNSGFTDTSALADRFLNMGEYVDWHPTSLWALQFGAKAAIALDRDEDVTAATEISDQYFSFQRVGGVHPCMLERVVSDRDFSTFIQPGSDYYMVDYHALSTLRDNASVSDSEEHGERQRRRYGYQPKALFVVVDGQLKPLAILIRRENKAELVEPEDPNWQIAKFVVQNADFNQHQLVGHLGRTHLWMEALAVSTGICLPKDVHPISKLLRPHLEGTINITDFATTDLINISPQSNNGGIFDHNFTGTMASNFQHIAEEVFGLYDQGKLDSDPQLAQRVRNLFNENIFPRDIANRGVGHFRTEKISRDGEPSSALIDIDVLHAYPGPEGAKGLGFSYPYLEDGSLLWNAITDWVCRYVSVYYAADLDVENDCELQHWAQTIVRDGKILGFGEYQNGRTNEAKILTRSYLVQAVSAMIFTASAQHSAVNFPQADFGHVMPAGLYHDYFGNEPGSLSDYLPNAKHFKEVMELWSVLSASQYTTLGKYHDNTSSGKKLRSVDDYFDNRAVRDSLKQFRRTLENIDETISERGAIGGYRYDYLRPSLIPQSVNV